jgi:hypothetical protein
MVGSFSMTQNVFTLNLKFLSRGESIYHNPHLQLALGKRGSKHREGRNLENTSQGSSKDK